MSTTSEALSYIDARHWETSERRCAMITFEDSTVMFTASWGAPSEIERRPDGAYRRQYLVHLVVPAEHQARAFQEAQSVMLCLTGERYPQVTSDIEGVTSREPHGLTMAIFIDEWH
jgi:hypothetical protein